MTLLVRDGERHAEDIVCVPACFRSSWLLMCGRSVSSVAGERSRSRSMSRSRPRRGLFFTKTSAIKRLAGTCPLTPLIFF